jgi:integrase
MLAKEACLALRIDEAELERLQRQCDARRHVATGTRSSADPRGGIRIRSTLALHTADRDFAHALNFRNTKNDRPTTALRLADVARINVFVDGPQRPVFPAGKSRISMRNTHWRLAQWFAKARIAGRSAHRLRHSLVS